MRRVSKGTSKIFAIIILLCYVELTKYSAPKMSNMIRIKKCIYNVILMTFATTLATLYYNYEYKLSFCRVYTIFCNLDLYLFW